MVWVWFQNIDGIMMARQFDTGKHSEYYRPIPVHTPSIRRLPIAKSYMNTNSETATSPRYDSEYDYKTTHYPSYPSNYPYDENKYKYEGQYNNYEKQQGYTSYEDGNYDSRNYAAPPHAPAVPSSNYSVEAEYPRYPNYEGRQPTYPTTDNPEYADKPRYGGSYGYDRTYYETDRYLTVESRHSSEIRYSDTRHAENRNPVDNREVEFRYPTEGRETERRYPVDGRQDEERYATDGGRDGGDARYALDGRGVDARFPDAPRYPHKENYYDRYYKHRPSRDHHGSETSRY